MSKGMLKQDVVDVLKFHWDTLSIVERRNYVQSLMGHRMKFTEIAKSIGRSIQDVKDAWMGMAQPINEPATVIAHGLEGLPSDCGGSSKYQGLIAPTCAGGKGCQKCWAVFYMQNHIDAKTTDPKVAEIAPVKALYSLSFDDILKKYREFINWTSEVVAPGVGPNDDDYLEGLIVSDIHAPFHDEAKLAKVIADTRGKVDVCILAGDGPDFHNYSKYMKYGQHFSVREEHKSFMAVLAMLSEAYPEVVMIPGNHDERTRKKYAQLLPADMYQAMLDFHGGNAFDFAELMTRQFENVIIPDTPKNGFAEYRFLFQINDIVVGHPELYSRIANRPVGNFIDWLMKKAVPMGLVKPFTAAVMGHTHQAGKTHNDFGIVGIENGCLCMTPDYDSGAKLSGALRPVVHGYTRFRTNKKTGITDQNDINFVRV